MDTQIDLGPYHIEYKDNSAEVHIYGNNSQHEVAFSLEEWQALLEFLQSIKTSVE